MICRPFSLSKKSILPAYANKFIFSSSCILYGQAGYAPMNALLFRRGALNRGVSYFHQFFAVFFYNLIAFIRL